MISASTPEKLTGMALKIAPSKGSLSIASSDLMPFHIEYTGLAPIVPTANAARDLTTTYTQLVQRSDSQKRFYNTSTSESQGIITSQTSVATSGTVVEALDPNPDGTISACDMDKRHRCRRGSRRNSVNRCYPEAGQSSGSWQRLITAFRGQQAVGRSVNLPLGTAASSYRFPPLTMRREKMPRRILNHALKSMSNVALFAHSQCRGRCTHGRRSWFDRRRLWRRNGFARCSSTYTNANVFAIHNLVTRHSRGRRQRRVCSLFS